MNVEGALALLRRHHYRDEAEHFEKLHATDAIRQSMDKRDYEGLDPELYMVEDHDPERLP